MLKLKLKIDREKIEKKKKQHLTCNGFLLIFFSYCILKGCSVAKSEELQTDSAESGIES